jgi:exopolysaccharide biosynthesis polyprenyl glycosylphosphotransferase
MKNQSAHRQLLFVVNAVVTLLISGLVFLLGPWAEEGATRGAGPVVLFMATCTVMLLIVLRLRKSYEKSTRSISMNAADSIGSLLGATLTTTVVLLSLDAIFPATVGAKIPAVAVLVTFASCSLVLPVVNAVVLRLTRDNLTRPLRIVVLGTGVIAEDVAARLRRSKQVDLLGFVDDDPMGSGTVLGGLDDLPSICEEQEVDRVVVAFSNSHPETTAWTLRQLSDRVAVDIVPRFFELTGWESELHDLHGLTVVTMGDSPRPIGKVLKRLVDVVGAAFVLVLTGPLLLVVAVLIRLDSPGPALFRQTRLGRDRQPFEVLKLRSMRGEQRDDDASSSRSRHARWADEDDRKTTIGRFIRRTGIDEIPQFLNVLRGEMSLVGPRPLLAQECQSLPIWAERRFEVRPGLTGIWQVCGQHELRPDELSRLDCQYVRDWSMWMDLRIIVLTPGRLIRGGGRGETLAPGWSSESPVQAFGPKRARTRTKSSNRPEGRAHGDLRHAEQKKDKAAS